MFHFIVPFRLSFLPSLSLKVSYQDCAIHKHFAFELLGLLSFEYGGFWIPEGIGLVQNSGGSETKWVKWNLNSKVVHFVYHFVLRWHFPGLDALSLFSCSIVMLYARNELWSQQIKKQGRTFASYSAWQYLKTHCKWCLFVAIYLM